MAGTPLTASGNTTNTVSITISAVSGIRHLINHLSASLDTDAIDIANTKITVESPDNTVLWQIILSRAGPAPITFPSDGIKGAVGEDMVIKLSGTDNITGYLNVIQVS